VPTIDDWIQLFKSKNRSVRIRAAKGILERSHEAPLSILIEILVSFSYEGLGAKTEQALIDRSDRELVSPMIELLSSADPWLREAACRILGHSGNTVATAHLLRMLDDPHVMVRRAAGFGLAYLKDQASLEQLRKLYERHKQDDINVVMALQCALKSLGGMPN